MGKNKSIVKNYIYNTLYQILTMIIPLITTPYISRVLGAENIGIYSYTISITTYFILFGSLGITMYGQREIAYVQDDLKKRSKVFLEIFIMRFITLTISLIIFYVTFCSNGEYSVYYKILILEIIASILDITWYFQGLEEFKKTVIRNTIIKIMSIIFIFLLVKNENDLFMYFMVYVISNLLGNLSLWMYVTKYLQKIKLKELNIKKHFKPAIVLFIPQIATQIYTVLDKTMLGIIIYDKSEVGFYEQAQKLVKLLMGLSTSLGVVVMPRIANYFANGEEAKLKKMLDKSISYIMMLAFPLTLGIDSIVNKFVPLFYGEGYTKVIYLIIVISPIIVLIGISNFIGMQYLIPTKRQKEFTISVIVGACVNFILNLILIKYFQSIGASIATVVAEMSVTIIQLYMVRKIIKFTDICRISYKYLLASFIMFCFSILIGGFIKSNLISIIVQISVSSIIYFGVLLLLKDKALFDIIDTLKKKLKMIG